MKRHFDDESFQRFLKNFEFLFKIIRESKGELDLRLRENYFNIYYRGNSLAKIEFDKFDYKISIHKKFIDNQEIFKDDSRFYQKGKVIGDYISYSVTDDLLHPFLQKEHLKRIYSEIREVNYGEEITFEQMIITDNMEREDWYIIDRQVTEKSFDGRIDLLALKQIIGNKYNFVVIEVKLGNNTELGGKVADQLNRYVKHINNNFDDWKQSYERYYWQIKKTKIFDCPSFESIYIIKDVKGMVAIGGYSGIASTKTKNLKFLHPEIEVKLFSNRL